MTWSVSFFISKRESQLQDFEDVYMYLVNTLLAVLCRNTDLHASLGEINPARQILPDEGVGVMRPLKHPLQCLQLTAVKRGPVSPLLPLLLLLRVQLLI